MTTAERRALVFLAAVASLGGATRLARAPRPDGGAPETRAALARQIARVDSARRSARDGRRRARRAGDGRSAGGLERRGTGTTRPSAGAAGCLSVVSCTAPAGGDVPAVVDLDVAGVAEIERLPRIGPALARRVVADRDSNGPYGSLAGLERVRGIGPGVARMLAPHVTFSGTPRPTSAELNRADTRVRAPSRRRRAPVNQTSPPRVPSRPTRGAAGVAPP